MLWVYGCNKYFISFSAGTVFRRPCAKRVNLYLLNKKMWWCEEVSKMNIIFGFIHIYLALL